MATSIAAADSKPNVDREARTVKNVIMAKVGEAKGWGYSIEASFLADMVKYVKKYMGGRVQCNMGHRWDANFFQLARFDNIRLADGGNTVIGDQTIYEAADKSPILAGMADWYLSIAEEDSQAVMASIKGSVKGFYQYDDKGNKVYIQYQWWSGPVKQFKDKPAYAEFKDLISCDIVDNGALTDALFSDGGGMEIAQQIAPLINTPGFMSFFRENEEHFPELQKHFQHKFKFSLPKTIKNLFTMSKETEDTPTPAAPAADPKPATEVQASQAVDIDAKISAALKPLQDKVATLETQLSAKDAEIAELKKKPAATPVPVKEDGASRQEMSSDNADQPWMNTEANRRVTAMLSKRQPTTT